MIGIWGLGYIGLTTAVAFAQQGVRVVCYDTDRKVLENIQKGIITQPNLEFWIGISLKDLVDDGLISVYFESELMNDCDAHFVCVPTEKDGKPTNEFVDDVMEKIPHGCLVIIESTLIPGTAQKYAEKHDVVVAPRRDFFESPEKNIRTLPRVFAGSSPEVSQKAQKILEIVSDNLIEAPDLISAELTKCVENSLLYLPVVYAMQLTRAYSHVDIRKVLQLCATHWRIPLYYPSAGCGGYCIPTSSLYVQKGTSINISLLKDATSWEHCHTMAIGQQLNRYGTVGILGICYKPDLKVHKGSPVIKIVDELQKPFVHDPYYSHDEIARIFSPKIVQPITYPDDLIHCDAILVATAHKRYIRTTTEELLGCLNKCKFILDNTGAWVRRRDLFKDIGIEYHIIGDKNWY